MRHLAYAAMLAFCLVGTVPLDRAFHLRLLRQVRRIALSILPVFVVFVLWDLAATHSGHWAFDPEQTLPLRLFGLPVEELGFFVVIPLAGLLTYEAVGVVLARGRAGRAGGARPARRARPGRGARSSRGARPARRASGADREQGQVRR